MNYYYIKLFKQYCYGGKGVGSQGDGSAQLICKSETDRNTLIQILETELKVECIPLTLGQEPIQSPLFSPATNKSNKQGLGNTNE